MYSAVINTMAENTKLRQAIGLNLLHFDCSGIKSKLLELITIDIQLCAEQKITREAVFSAVINTQAENAKQKQATGLN
jgi:hypothetical protein